MIHEVILEYTVSMFSGYMGPRAYKNAFTAYSAIAGEKKKKFTLARFCMGILVTLSLSKKRHLSINLFVDKRPYGDLGSRKCFNCK